MLFRRATWVLCDRMRQLISLPPTLLQSRTTKQSDRASSTKGGLDAFVDSIVKDGLGKVTGTAKSSGTSSYQIRRKEWGQSKVLIGSATYAKQPVSTTRNHFELPADQMESVVARGKADASTSTQIATDRLANEKFSQKVREAVSRDVEEALRMIREETPDGVVPSAACFRALAVTYAEQGNLDKISEVKILFGKCHTFPVVLRSQNLELYECEAHWRGRGDYRAAMRLFDAVWLSRVRRSAVAFDQGCDKVKYMIFSVVDKNGKDSALLDDVEAFLERIYQYTKDAPELSRRKQHFSPLLEYCAKCFVQEDFELQQRADRCLKRYPWLQRDLARKSGNLAPKALSQDTIQRLIPKALAFKAEFPENCSRLFTTLLSLQIQASNVEAARQTVESAVELRFNISPSVLQEFHTLCATSTVSLGSVVKGHFTVSSAPASTPLSKIEPEKSVYKW